jgi:hypothetical protein
MILVGRGSGNTERLCRELGLNRSGFGWAEPLPSRWGADVLLKPVKEIGG